ncbi:MAG: DegT/DnrJ/EryC1/StrS family aminotransferase [Burkholderiaceae bacterium]|nr:DegT/DnrJ/EryC1/StrS family aminotransferase [Burkholderiaceae bacterium]
MPSLPSVSPIALFSAAAVNGPLGLGAVLQQALDTHWYVLGPQVQGFEEAFAAYVGVPHAVGVANGTDALELALRAAGVQRGDRVLTVANAGFYSSTALHAIGAVPVYVDVDEASLTLSPAALAQALAAPGPKPVAVVVTHLYGQLADMPALLPLCRAAGLVVIEDCAQAHGAEQAGRQAGAWGDLACFSFYPTKNLGALGDGGAVLTASPDRAERLRALRQYGWSHKYTVAVPGGGNSRLDALQAAVLHAKLPHLAAHNAARRATAARYNAAFAGLPLRCPPSVGADFVAHLYVLRTARREALRGFLQARGIATEVHYPLADHQQPAYPGACLAGGLPVTEAACATALTLPCYPGLPAADVERVVVAVQDFFAQEPPAC